jgi:hypothetical protein
MENTDQEFHVTYFDADCGRARSEAFDTMIEAQRFADRHCAGENSWAVIDAVSVVSAKLAA